jgi:hypothetical protein
MSGGKTAAMVTDGYIFPRNWLQQFVNEDRGIAIDRVGYRILVALVAT